MANKIAIVMKGYPRLSETFIAQELLGLQDAGLDFSIYALRRPHDTATHPVHQAITAPVDYLPEYLHDAPLTVARALWRCRRMPGFKTVWSLFWRDLKRDFSRNRFRRLGQAFVLASRLPPDVTWIYVHFLHTPASVTHYAAVLKKLPWSCSAHAKDIYTTTDWDKREKIAGLEWLVTCTAANVEYLRKVAPENASKIDLVYHGLDLARFLPPSARQVELTRPVTILSVGRAVEKKGYPDVLAALSSLPDDLDWRFVHIGGGDDLGGLKAKAAELGLSKRIEWLGAQPQETVLNAYASADIFVLASRIADDGDRDGLPNVLMEAQSQNVACIATQISAIPELITDGETGVLVPPGDSHALAEAIVSLASDPALRARLASAGGTRVREHFSHEAGIRDLAGRFGLAARTLEMDAAQPVVPDAA
ncbi:MAG: glycosyltransferase family 4 protein [Hyphomicrobiaceae bacterium]